MGSRQIGELCDVTRTVWEKDHTYRCCAVMAVSGYEYGRHYRFFFDHDLRVREFVPMDLRLDVGIGFDTVKEKATREALIKAVEDFNQYMGLTYYEGPFIQSIRDSSYIVTFYSVPKTTIRRKRLMDPYVSFLLTKDKKVFGIFWGS
jgi:hypothetical protein